MNVNFFFEVLIGGLLAMLTRPAQQGIATERDAHHPQQIEQHVAGAQAGHAAQGGKQGQGHNGNHGGGQDLQQDSG